MGLRICKDFEFSASHVIAGLPESHKCARLHGHSYRVRVAVSGAVDEVGFIIDYGELAWIRELIDTRLDHRHLNDVLAVNPTAENIAVWLAEQVCSWLQSRPERQRIRGVEIGVSETPTTWAIYSAELPSV
ncbi:6-carboxytetrahydropterin synthase QueD [Mycolicibacterium llatzerense]|uniref:6-carboxytetrahydropterin synthase QueD n=1 Tax=Mycolicibacterium llatzerense TaxID=280871 RepID=UPI0021B65843|nr:6-carboxytetrahydropterin synthase QueD [Mycolicibacterium llatzerense]MCT7362884.1 6-carboxytetrahydropterin synthase QueD [Mycolicibacterium llatzerense]